MALLAELLSLPNLAAARSHAAAQAGKAFEALLRQSGVGAAPVLMMFDDVHWIDPSSRELLDRMIERVADGRCCCWRCSAPSFSRRGPGSRM